MIKEYIVKKSIGNNSGRVFSQKEVGELVRCKDCKYNPKSLGWVTCPMTGANTRKDDDFCSYGERKEKGKC